MSSDYQPDSSKEWFDESWIPAAPVGRPPVGPVRKRRRMGLPAAVAASALAVAGVGAVIGHVAWQSTTPSHSSSALSALSGTESTGSIASSRSSGSNRSTGSRGSSGSNGSSGSLGGSASDGSGLSGGSSASGSDSTASGAPTDAASIAKVVDAGLVDINTVLGYDDEEAAGTGMVLTSNGEVLTNNHVIDGATSISVTDVNNGNTYKATVVGYDVSQDIAVLQLKGASGLKTVSVGDSSDLNTGEAIVGIGNAGGTGGTPSYAGGSITALNQSITASDEGAGTSEQLSGLIGSNANIQPGDSGGPLADSAGQVIGMDTAASSGYGGMSFQFSGSSTTQAFAIPISEATTVADQIEAHTASSVIHLGPTSFLGVSVESAGDGVSAGLGGSAGYGYYGDGGQSSGGTSGALIAGVVPRSAAAQAGLGEGDTITSLGGRAVTSASSLTKAMQSEAPGDSPKLVYVDPSGQTHSVQVQLASGPPQ